MTDLFVQDVFLQELVLAPAVLLAVLLAAAYVFARARDKRLARAQQQAAEDGLTSTAPRFSRRPPFSRAPAQAAKPTAKPIARRDTRPQRERVLDLHQRGAIFALTDGARIDGYQLTPLGEVRVDAGPNYETRLKRAAGGRFADANALTSLREVRQHQRYLAGTGRDGKPIFKTRLAHEWRAMAVQAVPVGPDLAAPPTYRDDIVLIDGSNLIHWEVDAGRARAPSLRPVTQVIAALKAKGVAAGVVFDATAGHALEGRFLGHDDLANRLPGAADVLVVDRGTQADWVLVDMARAEGLVIISNDHFRDAPSARHLLKQKGFVAGAEIELLPPRA